MMRDKPMAKRSTKQVWERTLWAIRGKNGRLLSDAPYSPALVLFRTLREALSFCRNRDDDSEPDEKPVKVRERIEVIE